MVLLIHNQAVLAVLVAAEQVGLLTELLALLILAVAAVELGTPEMLVQMVAQELLFFAIQMHLQI